MSTTGTPTLTEFLLDRIAEDEAVARAAATDGYGAIDWAGESGPTDVHIARHDPARVLADCEAKRRLIAIHWDFQWSAEPDPDEDRTFGCYECHGPCLILGALAMPYADHPDYRDEWRP